MLYSYYYEDVIKSHLNGGTMKKYLLLSLVLFGNLFGIKIEKNGISIESRGSKKYRSIKLGSPQTLDITNRSNKPIVIDSSIISTPLCSYQEVVQALRKQMAFLVAAQLAFCALWSVRFVFDMDTLYKDRHSRIASPRTVNLSRLIVALDITLFGLLGGSAGYYWGERDQLKFSLQKELLHEPITIQPGESIEKLFWLKNSKDQIKIDFDAIKVLK